MEILTSVMFLAVIGGILFSLVMIVGVVLLSIYAYKCGIQSGNTKTSVLLIILGVFIGFTLVPGLCHLAGTSEYNKRTLEAISGKVVGS
jgi:hypothetical protein